MFYSNIVYQAGPIWVTNVPYYRNPLQHDHMNGNIYPVYSPKENNVKNMFVMSASQTNINPCNLHRYKEKTLTNFYQEELLNWEVTNEEGGEKDVHTKKVEKDVHTKKVDKYSNKPCWHFLRGYCERGDSCRFQHRFTDADYQSQKVFLSGLPSNITELSLRKQLSDLGYNVVNKLLSLHKSWPRICLGSPQEAQMLFQRGKISISGHTVEVRPWHEVATKKRDRVAEITQRSVFLGGIPKGVTGKMIRARLEKLDAKVLKLSQVRRGFCPKVTLATAQQAFSLVSAGKIEIMGKLVEVRPYRPRNSFNGSKK